MDALAEDGTVFLNHSSSFRTTGAFRCRTPPTCFAPTILRASRCLGCSRARGSGRRSSRRIPGSSPTPVSPVRSASSTTFHRRDLPKEVRLSACTGGRRPCHCVDRGEARTGFLPVRPSHGHPLSALPGERRSSVYRTRWRDGARVVPVRSRPWLRCDLGNLLDLVTVSVKNVDGEMG
jgi:hypothetical protein